MITRGAFPPKSTTTIAYQLTNPLICISVPMQPNTSVCRSLGLPKLLLTAEDNHSVKSLQELASALGIGVLIVHHVRKSIGETDPFEKVSGTLGLTGAADTALILDRDGNGCSLYGRGHDIQEFEKAISFSKEVCRWTIQGEASEVRRTDERSVILQVLLEQSEPMSPAEVSNATGMPRNNVKQLLFKMAKDGEVAKTKRGQYLHPDAFSPEGDNSDRQ